MLHVLALLLVAAVVSSFWSTPKDKEDAARWVKAFEPWATAFTIIIVAAMFGPMLWKWLVSMLVRP